MSKKLIIIVAVIVLLIVLAGVGFTQLRKSKPSQNLNPANITVQVTKTEDNSNKGSLKGTLKSLLSLNKPVTCTYKFTPQNGGGTGTIYVSGKKMSGNFKSTVDQKTSEANVIYDGEYSYVWSPNDTNGVKMKIDPQTQTSSSSAENTNFDWNKELEYTCVPWAVDTAKFTPPINIKFSDISQMLQQTKPSGSTVKTPQNAQSVCDQITDPTAKAQCIKSLSGY